MYLLLYFSFRCGGGGGGSARKMESVGGREYKYFTEISQMMFVFGEVQDPMSETVNLVEDIVKSQIIELVSVVCGSRDVRRA